MYSKYVVPLKYVLCVVDQIRRYISQIVLDRSGVVIKTYHKYNLWSPDFNWADPGKQLGDVVEITTKSNSRNDEALVDINCSSEQVHTLRCGLGICADLLRYWDSKAEFRKNIQGSSGPQFLIADSYKTLDIDIVLFSTAEPLYDEYDFAEYFEEVHNIKNSVESAPIFMKQHPEMLEDSYLNGTVKNHKTGKSRKEELLETLLNKQWTEPLKSLFDSEIHRKRYAFDSSSNSRDDNKTHTPPKPFIYLVSNRVGKETSDCVFSGASAVYTMNAEEPGKVNLVDNLEIIEPGILITNIKV